MREAKQERLARDGGGGYEEGMSWTRRFIYCFWIFIVIMLLWQLYQYNSKITRVDPLHPTQTQVFFYHSKTRAEKEAPVQQAGPDVQQTAFSVEDKVPSSASFTCRVTLTNKGQAKAEHVQVAVRPYRGTIQGDEDVGVVKNVEDSSPLGQLSQWVTFPDLEPGASSTQSAVFLRQVGANPGRNPSPKIIFSAEKK